MYAQVSAPTYARNTLPDIRFSGTLFSRNRLTCFGKEMYGRMKRQRLIMISLLCVQLLLTNAASRPNLFV